MQQRHCNCQTSRDPSVDFLRGVAIIGVLCIHARFSSRFDLPTAILQLALSRFFDWAVLAFFLIGGFLHNFSVSFKHVLWKRLQSLVVPYLFYNLAYNLLFLTRRVQGGTNKYEMATIPEISIPHLFSKFLVSPAFQLYFLAYLFVITVSTHFFLCRLRPQIRITSSVMLICLFLFYYMYHGFPQFSHGREIGLLPLYASAFLLGNVITPLTKLKGKGRWVFPLLLCGLLVLNGFHYTAGISLPISALLFLSFSSFPVFHSFPSFQLLGRYSGSIYVWHTPIVMPAMSSLFYSLGVSPLMGLFLTLGATLSACLVARWYLDLASERYFGARTPRFISL